MNAEHILLIDDDKDDQYIFIEALNEMQTGIKCCIANDGFEALGHLNNNDGIPSLIFLDLNMPLMNGFEFMEKIRATDAFWKIPIVVMTTSDNPSDKNRAHDLGALFFFTKTSEFKKLKEIMEEILQARFSILPLHASS